MQFTDLGEDLVDHILTSLPDFNSLASATRVSKAVHRVYKTHPSSIVHAVAQNVVGPLAFPAAMRFLRKPSMVDWWGLRISYINTHVKPRAGPDEVHIVQQSINRWDSVKELVENEKVVRALEDVFSWRCKDRRSSSSRLSPEESMRFHRAAYRFWLFCTSFCYPARVVPFQAGGEINHSEYHAQFLRPFSAEELLDIRRVADFCADMVGWVTDYQTITARPVSAEQTAIFTAYCRSNAELAPDYALEIYKRLRIFDKQTHVRSFFWGAYDRAIAEKLPTTAQDREERLAKAILSEVYGEHDTCHRCHAVGGLKLYGKTNWHWMRGEFNWTKLRGLLPGNLPPNKYEGGRLAQRVCTPDGYARMMEEIFDARCAPPQQMHAQAHAPGAGAWDAEGLYCAACVEVLLGERLWVWCDARQQRESDSVREDCCYGWDCRTQVHNIEHAEMLNHFCMPARDDSEDPESHRV